MALGRAPHLPPGFKFRPSDEELASHYLLPRQTYGVVAEADLLEHEPWELPDVWKKGTSSPEDDEWYFFSPRRICTSSMAGGPARQQRLTRGGYWKATGKDRAINIEHYFLPAASNASGGSSSGQGSFGASTNGSSSTTCSPNSSPVHPQQQRALQGGSHSPSRPSSARSLTAGGPNHLLAAAGLVGSPGLEPSPTACDLQHAHHQLQRVRMVVMKKTLVFYQGRAPWGTKTNWIMHEYRLEEDTRDEKGSLEKGRGGESGVEEELVEDEKPLAAELNSSKQQASKGDAGESSGTECEDNALVSRTPSLGFGDAGLPGFPVLSWPNPWSLLGQAAPAAAGEPSAAASPGEAQGLPCMQCPAADVITDIRTLPAFKVVLCKVFNKRRDCKLKYEDGKTLGAAGRPGSARGARGKAQDKPAVDERGFGREGTVGQKGVCGKRPSKQGQGRRRRVAEDEGADVDEESEGTDECGEDDDDEDDDVNLSGAGRKMLKNHNGNGRIAGNAAAAPIGSRPASGPKAMAGSREGGLLDPGGQGARIKASPGSSLSRGVDLRKKAAKEQTAVARPGALDMECDEAPVPLSVMPGANLSPEGSCPFEQFSVLRRAQPTSVQADEVRTAGKPEASGVTGALLRAAVKPSGPPPPPGVLSAAAAAVAAARASRPKVKEAKAPLGGPQVHAMPPSRTNEDKEDLPLSAHLTYCSSTNKQDRPAAPLTPSIPPSIPSPPPPSAGPLPGGLAHQPQGLHFGHQWAPHGDLLQKPGMAAASQKAPGEHQPVGSPGVAAVGAMPGGTGAPACLSAGMHGTAAGLSSPLPGSRNGPWGSGGLNTSAGPSLMDMLELRPEDLDCADGSWLMGDEHVRPLAALGPEAGPTEFCGEFSAGDELSNLHSLPVEQYSHSVQHHQHHERHMQEVCHPLWVQEQHQGQVQGLPSVQQYQPHQTCAYECFQSGHHHQAGLEEAPAGFGPMPGLMNSDEAPAMSSGASWESSHLRPSSGSILSNSHSSMQRADSRRWGGTCLDQDLETSELHSGGVYVQTPDFLSGPLCPELGVPNQSPAFAGEHQQMPRQHSPGPSVASLPSAYPTSGELAQWQLPADSEVPSWLQPAETYYAEDISNFLNSDHTPSIMLASAGGVQQHGIQLEQLMRHPSAGSSPSRSPSRSPLQSPDTGDYYSYYSSRFLQEQWRGQQQKKEPVQQQPRRALPCSVCGRTDVVVLEESSGTRVCYWCATSGGRVEKSAKTESARTGCVGSSNKNGAGTKGNTGGGILSSLLGKPLQAGRQLLHRTGSNAKPQHSQHMVRKPGHSESKAKLMAGRPSQPICNCSTCTQQLKQMQASQATCGPHHGSPRSRHSSSSSSSSSSSAGSDDERSLHSMGSPTTGPRSVRTSISGGQRTPDVCSPFAGTPWRLHARTSAATRHEQWRDAPNSALIAPPSPSRAPLFRQSWSRHSCFRGWAPFPHAPPRPIRPSSSLLESASLAGGDRRPSSFGNFGPQGRQGCLSSAFSACMPCFGRRRTQYP